MKLIIAKNLTDYNILKNRIIRENPKEKDIAVIFTNCNMKIDKVFKKYKNIHEGDIVISPIAGDGAEYNKLIDSIWFKIQKRKVSSKKSKN